MENWLAGRCFRVRGWSAAFLEVRGAFPEVEQHVGLSRRAASPSPAAFPPDPHLGSAQPRQPCPPFDNQEATVVDIFRYSYVAESGAKILNPLSPEKLLLLGELAGLKPGMSQLDLACGKGEMLCQYARRHGVRGTGIDIYAPFVELAEQRARDLGVADEVKFRVGDASTHREQGRFDVVSCIGATWIGGGFSGAVQLMRENLVDGGTMLVGEVFSEGEIPADAARRHQGTLSELADLGGILRQTEALGVELVEMVLASRDDWDRYSSRHWAQAHAWLQQYPQHEEAEGIRDWMTRSRRTYLTDERRWMQWGVFVLR